MVEVVKTIGWRKQGRHARPRPAGKAQLLANSFAAKRGVPINEANRVSSIKECSRRQEQPELPGVEYAAQVLRQLREDSALGPDLVPARVLKRMAEVLAKPLADLVQCIMFTCVCPDTWRLHWLVPLYKKKPHTIP